MKKKKNVNAHTQKFNMIDKKLIGYSLAAGAVLAGSKSYAAVQYSGLLNIYLNRNDSYVLFIPPGIGSRNIYFTVLMTGNYASAGAVNIAGQVPYIKAFNNGQTIGPSQIFGGYRTLNRFTGGPFVNQGQKYMGILTGSSYGWIRVTVLWPPAPLGLIIHDWAYEDIPGLPILAGSQTSLSVAMTDFTAAIENGEVELNWTTQSEVDNLGFILERRELDQKGDILNDWAEIASYLTRSELQGKGNTSEQTQYNFIDVNAIEGSRYEYRLTDVDGKGDRNEHPVLLVLVENLVPDNVMLFQNYPNPFNPSTTIRYGIPEAGRVKLSVYNLKGQTVEVLVDAIRNAGYNDVRWDASGVPSGLYFYELIVGNHREVRKLHVVK